MAKNLIPEIARMLGVEIGEEFKIKGYEEWFYKFDNDRGLMFKHNDDVKMPVAPVSVYVAFLALLRGECEIIKLPWKPKKGDAYYTFEVFRGKWVVRSLWWTGAPCNYALLDKGWVFRTKEEAEDALPKVAKKMGVEYEILEEKSAICCKNLL